MTDTGTPLTITTRITVTIIRTTMTTGTTIKDTRTIIPTAGRVRGF